MIGLNRFPDKQAFQRYQSRLQVAWEQYMSGETRTPDLSVVPFRIAESWKRSQGYGLDPFHYQSYIKMKKLDIKSREKQLLTNEATGYWFGDLAKKHAFNVSIFDAQGNKVALLSEKDHSPSFANEMILGTNAAALALLENRSGCVLAQEHYSRFFHQRFCMAAPFHSTNQNVVGTICISTLDFEIIHSLSEMAEQFAGICTLIFNLAHQASNDDDETFRAILANLANLSAPILYVDDHEKMQSLSQHAQKLLARYKKSDGTHSDLEEGQLRLYLNGGSGKVDGSRADGQKGVSVVKPIRQIAEQPSLKESRPECSMEFSDIVGNAPQLVRCIRFAKQAALTDFAIVLNGESGAGKDIFAQAIHNASPRREGPFVALNCGAIASELVESELFGYEEGAFTGADRQGKIGLLEKASGGTLFLDEVESMPLAVQSKLLRVLSSGNLSRVGNTAEIPVDFRVISASKIDLREAAEQGKFREDLFYRISVVSLKVPPLRDRKEDIPQLVWNFLNRAWGGSIQVSQEAMAVLCAYDWPGNVRELENVLIHACVFSQKGVITLESLPEEFRSAGRFTNILHFLQERCLLTDQGTARISQIETELIRAALEKNNFVLKQTAQMLNIDRKTLCRKIKQDSQLTQLVNDGLDQEILSRTNR